MVKNLLNIFTALFLSIAMPLSVVAMPLIEISETSDINTQEIVVTYSNDAIHVMGATGQTMYVYNVTGVQVMTATIDGPDKYISVDLPKGCYVVKIGKVVRKISVNK